FIAAIHAGAWFTDACRETGVKKSTAYEWIRRARGEDPRPATPEHVAFADAVDAAFATRRTVVELPFAATSQVDTGDTKKASTSDHERAYDDESGQGTTGRDGAYSDSYLPARSCTWRRKRPSVATASPQRKRPRHALALRGRTRRNTG